MRRSKVSRVLLVILEKDQNRFSGVFKGFTQSLMSPRQDWGRAFSSGESLVSCQSLAVFFCVWAVAGGCLWLSLLPRGVDGGCLPSASGNGESRNDHGLMQFGRALFQRHTSHSSERCLHPWAGFVWETLHGAGVGWAKLQGMKGLMCVVFIHF